MTLTANRRVGFLSKVERSCVRNKMQILCNRRRAVKPMEENTDVFFPIDVFFAFNASLYLPAGHPFSYQDRLNSFISQLNEKTCHTRHLTEVVAIVLTPYL